MFWQNVLVALMASVFAVGQVVAADAPIAVPQTATYLPGINPDEAVRACDWHGAITKALVERAPRTFLPTGSSDKIRFALSLVFTQLDLKSGARKNEYQVTARAEIRHDGKLVATRDETTDESFTVSEGGCVALRVRDGDQLI